MHDLNVWNKQKYISEYEELKRHENMLELGNKIFSNKKMIKTFPNLKLKGENGEIIYMDSIYKEIQPYYFKFFNPAKNNSQ